MEKLSGPKFADVVWRTNIVSGVVTTFISNIVSGGVGNLLVI